jgi:hypothetical protein
VSNNYFIWKHNISENNIISVEVATVLGNTTALGMYHHATRLTETHGTGVQHPKLWAFQNYSSQWKILQIRKMKERGQSKMSTCFKRKTLFATICMMVTPNKKSVQKSH